MSRTTLPPRSPAVTRPCAAISWSGGTDSCLALLRGQADYNVIAMITMFGEDGGPNELELRGIDACGENGEYHTLVTHTRLFDAPPDVRIGRHEMHADCWALDVSLAHETEHAAR